MITLGPDVQILAYQAAMVFAQNQAPGTPGYNDNPIGPEFGKASPIGIPVVLLLLIATVLLIRNMNKHIKNLPESFDAEHPEPDQLADEGTDRAGVEAGPDADTTPDAR
ncbi:hypothetical protein [Rhodococcus sp. IEGM 1408]|uniref:hypothetical protein n=1 Tax=Rhodococcus sp. IEGM 1408 TaxID=3082220 RepID=UPI003989352A